MMNPLISTLAHYCVPVVWIGFYLYHGIRLGNPSPTLKGRFQRHYSSNQTLAVTKYLSIGAWLGALLTALSMLTELAGMPVDSSLAGFFYGCILLVYILILHLYVKRKVE